MPPTSVPRPDAMIEPPAPGFTGVVWEARPTEQLARELTGGPGSVPLVEAATAWTGLAASFGAAVVEYDRILLGIRSHWESDTSDTVLERISAMRGWLTETAAAAARNAEHTALQAASFEVARLAMPHTAEIAALDQAVRVFQAIGTSLGGPLVGVAATIDADTDAAKATAARVMRIYEAAAEPLAQPWQHTTPPPLSTPEALEAEQVVAQRVPDPVAGTSVPPIPVLPQFSVPPVLGGARVQTVATTVARAEVVTTAAPPVNAGTATPVVPPGALAAAAQDEDEHTPRAGDAGGFDAAELELDAGPAAVPAVLGGIAVQVTGVEQA